MKVEKLREERDRAWRKAAEWQARARDLEKQITEQENLQIVSAVRAVTASPEELADILAGIRSMKGLQGGSLSGEEKKEERKTGSGEGEENEE